VQVGGHPDQHGAEIFFVLVVLQKLYEGIVGPRFAQVGDPTTLAWVESAGSHEIGLELAELRIAILLSRGQLPLSARPSE